MTPAPEVAHAGVIPPSSSFASAHHVRNQSRNAAAASTLALMELYVRLVELRNWLRKHDDAGEGTNGDSNQGNGSARGNVNASAVLSFDCDEPLQLYLTMIPSILDYSKAAMDPSAPLPSAPSVLAVLVQLLNMSQSSSMAGVVGGGGGGVGSSGGSSSSSPLTLTSMQSVHPPVLSHAIRITWAEAMRVAVSSIRSLTEIE
ncbi:MAG: hypothetical protein ACREBR_02790 [bacterium]